MKKLIVLATFAAILASCTSDEDFAPQNALPRDGEIRISTQVRPSLATRAATEAEPYEGTTLGLYIRPCEAPDWNNETDKYTFPNVMFAKNGQGEWSQSQHATMPWKGENANYEFYAYAPAQADVTDGKIPFDLTVQGERPELENDLLWVGKTGMASTLVAGQKLNIELAHAFCKVAVQVTLAEEFYQDGKADNPITDIKISSNSVSGKLSVFDGTVVNGNEDGDNPQPGELTFTVNEGSHATGTATSKGEYTSPYIFHAPVSEQFKVTITADGRTFSYTHPTEHTFESGKLYLIKLNIGKDETSTGKDETSTEKGVKNISKGVTSMGKISARLWQTGTCGTWESE